jgi:hypothetical protein
MRVKLGCGHGRLIPNILDPYPPRQLIWLDK